jgi:hypothetical protein
MRRLIGRVSVTSMGVPEIPLPVIAHARLHGSRKVGHEMSNNPDFIEVQKFLGGVDYPANRDDLVRTAEGAGAGDDMLKVLRSLPERDYANPTEVSEAVAG